MIRPRGRSPGNINNRLIRGGMEGIVAPHRQASAIGTEGATRVADVLLLFLGDSHELGVTQVARELDTSKAVVHRVLQSMVNRGLLVQDPGNRMYRLGPAAVAIGARALRDCDLRSVAEPILSSLRDATSETTTLSQRNGHDRAYIVQFPSPQEIKMLVEIGRTFPLHAGSSSKVILANLGAAEQVDVVKGALEQLTPQTVIDPQELAVELEHIRQQGYAVSRGERQPGAGAVAAPVFDFAGNVVGAISVCGPSQRFDELTVARLIPQVSAAAAAISEGMGWANDASARSSRGDGSRSRRDKHEKEA